MKSHNLILENVYTSLEKILNFYDLSFEKSILYAQINFHNSRFSLKAIGDILKSYSILSLAVSINIDQLKSIPLPAIVHLKIKDNHSFYTLDRIEHNAIILNSHSKGIMRVSIQNFEKMWQGVVLILEPITNEKIKNKLNVKLIRNILLCLSLVVLLTFSLLLNSPSFFLISKLFVNVLGILTSVLIIYKSNGFNNKILEKVCVEKMDSIFSCEKTIIGGNKYFGIISYPVLGLSYFLFSMSMFLFNIYIIEFQLLIFVIGAPLIIYLQYRQIFILKSICPLCLFIALLFFIEYGLHYFTGYNKSSFFIKDGGIIILCIWTSYFLATGVDYMLKMNKQVDEYKWKEYNLKTSEHLFHSLLEQSSSIDFNKAPRPLSLNQSKTKNTLSVILSTSCLHCARLLEKVIRFSELCPNTRFDIYVDVDELSDNNIQISRIMAARSEEGIKMLKNYYDGRKLLNEDVAVQCEYVSTYLEWKRNKSFNYFPRIYLNSIMVSNFYKVEDLIFHLK